MNNKPILENKEEFVTVPFFLWKQLGPIRVKLNNGKAFVECKEVNKDSHISVDRDFFLEIAKNKKYIPFNIIPGKGFEIESWLLDYKNHPNSKPDYSDNNYVLVYLSIPLYEGL